MSIKRHPRERAAKTSAPHSTHGQRSTKTATLARFTTSPHVVTPKQDRSRDALARIVKAAESLLRDKGIEGLSMAAVSAKAGIPVGNIYRRFQSKAAIVCALKQDATDRIEHAIVELVSATTFADMQSVVRGFVEVSIAVFSHDEDLHRVLFARSVDSAELERIGSSGRRRIFESYRDALLPFLSREGPSRAQLLAAVSFQIIATAIVGKARGDDRILAGLSWRVLGREFAAAAIAYLSANVHHVAPRSRASRVAQNANATCIPV